MVNGSADRFPDIIGKKRGQAAFDELNPEFVN